MDWQEFQTIATFASNNFRETLMKSETFHIDAGSILSKMLMVGMIGFVPLESRADEEVLGYVKGAEPLPKGALEVVQWVTVRSDKGVGHYRAWDYKTEVEYGITDRLSGELNILAMGINTSGILIDGYVPGDKKYGFKLSPAWKVR
jgi:hypothetical protein